MGDNIQQINILKDNLKKTIKKYEKEKENNLNIYKSYESVVKRTHNRSDGYEVISLSKNFNIDFNKEKSEEENHEVGVLNLEKTEKSNKKSRREKLNLEKE